MQARCEQCGEPLPGLAPGYVLLTCRQCRTTYHVRDDGRFRRVGSPEPSGAEAPHGAVSVAPPNFVLAQGDGTLRVGWMAPSFDALYMMLGILLAALLAAVRFMDVVATFEAFQWTLVGVALVLGLYPAIAAAYNMTWLEMQGHTLRISSKPLPMFGSVTVDVRTLHSVFVQGFTRKGGKGLIELKRFAVRVKTRDGQKLTLVGGFENEAEPTWLAGVLRRHLGLKDGPWDTEPSRN
jgi:hypothetical protein